MVILYSIEDFNKLLDDCIDYRNQEVDDNQVTEYDFELANINFESDANKFDALIHSGIFHDAIGKPIEWTDNFVTVTTEY